VRPAGDCRRRHDEGLGSLLDVPTAGDLELQDLKPLAGSVVRPVPRRHASEASPNQSELLSQQGKLGFEVLSVGPQSPVVRAPVGAKCQDPMMAGVPRNAVAQLVAALVCLPASVSGLERPAGRARTGSSGLAVAGTRDAAVLAWVKALRCAPTLWAAASQDILESSRAATHFDRGRLSPHLFLFDYGHLGFWGHCP